MTSPMPTMSVAGMAVPLPLVPRIVAAVRAQYPTVTAGISDDNAAVQAVLKLWVTNALVTYETQQAEAPVDDEVAAVRADYATRAQNAREKAMADAALIVSATPPA